MVSNNVDPNNVNIIIGSNDNNINPNVIDNNSGIINIIDNGIINDNNDVIIVDSNNHNTATQCLLQ